MYYFSYKNDLCHTFTNETGDHESSLIFHIKLTMILKSRFVNFQLDGSNLQILKQ